MTWYPSYKHFQQQSHARQNRSVFPIMVLSGTVHKRPLPRVTGQREYHMIAKGGSARYGQIYGPYCQHSPYPPKVNSFFALLCHLMYSCKTSIKSHSNHKKVPSFAMRLEGTLNQLVAGTGRIIDQKVQQHLKDCLFHVVCKCVRTSI